MFSTIEFIRNYYEIQKIYNSQSRKLNSTNVETINKTTIDIFTTLRLLNLKKGGD